ncbi:MAG: DUF362 domain-containing protein [candidate division WOR-3 bacterium]
MGYVFFSPVSENPPLSVVRDLIKKGNYLGDVKKGDFVGIKLHIGELGNKAYVKPEIIKVIVEEVKAQGGKPFLFDCNTLYRGKRWNAIDHFENAYLNGFTYEAVGAPFFVGDGLRGRDETKIKIKDYDNEFAYVGRIIEDMDYLFVVTHFKFHEFFGYGGAIKNVGMGMASRRGKLFLHSDVRPDVTSEKCIGCGACLVVCPSNSISISTVATINKDFCIGCGMCVVTCREGAIKFEWLNTRECVIKTIYYAKAIIDKVGKCSYLNVLTDITPHCDCYGYTKSLVVQDIGFLFSKDIVSIDAASVDLINEAIALPGINWKREEFISKDKAKALFDIPLCMDDFFEIAEKIGLGERKYTLKRD